MNKISTTCILYYYICSFLNYQFLLYLSLTLLYLRDLLLMAGESMREDVSLKPQSDDQLLAPELAAQSKEQVQLTESQVQTEEGTELKPALFPKTQGCQTELVEEVAGKEERAVRSVAVEGRKTGWLRGLLRLLVGFLALLLVFTFLCGYEYEGRVYYPITYSPLRFVNVTQCMHAGGKS